MAEPASTRPRIDDPAFQHAVELIDGGDAPALQAWLDDQPQLLEATAEEDGSFAGDYFRAPRLLWFVAENPIRNGRLPQNIGSVAQAIIDASTAHDVDDLGQVVDYTLSLVCSGCVPRESGVLSALIETLVGAGADPNGAMRPALAHGERGVAEALLEHGASATLAVCAGLGREDEMQRRFDDASDAERFEALCIAAINGQSTTTRILLDKGVDPNRHCPAGLHAHATPLHNAINAGSTSTVCTLVTRGADVVTKDRMFDGDAMGWARHLGRSEIIALLEHAAVMMPAVRAVRAGDVGALESWLTDNAAHVNARIGDNPRTLLHYATDWPGHLPRVGETIALLCRFGADLDARVPGDADFHRETPLHWAASSNDVAAAEALLDAGAEINVGGGCIDDATPLGLAVIFKQREVAELLRARGGR